MEIPRDQQIQIFYELAFSIGNDLDINKMLREVLMTINHKLCCSTAAVFKRDFQQNTVSLLYSIPDQPQNNLSYKKAMLALDNVLKQTECYYPLIESAKNDEFYYLMELEDFGFLLFIKAGDRLPDMIIKSMADINKKLATACKACFTQKALSESETRYRVMIESSPAAILITDLKGIISDCNNSALEMFDFSARAQIIGSSFYNRISETDREKAALVFKEADSKEHSQNIEYRLLKSTGEEIWTALSSSVIFDPDKNPLGIIINAQDISKHKHMEYKFRQSEKMKSIGQLAGGIAHDFNNQLTGIVGCADILQEELQDRPQLISLIDSILQASKRASDLTAQLLAFARKGRNLEVVLDIHEIILEVINMLRRTFDKKIIIEENLQAENSVVMGDPTQIQNALLNIAFNSRDAMPEGGVLSFDSSLEDFSDDQTSFWPVRLPPGEYIKICITDNGYGMNDVTKKKIFEPFFTTKEVGKGTGMGLASVYGTMKSHGGSIDVYSELGYGTSMKLYFPLHNDQIIKKKKGNTNGRKSQGSGRILLIDDEELILDIAAKILEQSGYQVFEFLHSNEALEFYRKNWQKIDLLILDMVMPFPDGRECFKQMKKFNPEIRALLSSGYSINGEAQKLLDEGIRGFIQKPFRKKNLLEKVDQILNS